MALLGGVLRPGAPRRLIWFMLGVDGLLTFDGPPKPEAHCREHFFAESVLPARAEPGVERRREDVSRNRFFDGGFYSPATFARILDVSGKAFQLRIFRELSRAQV